MTISDKAADAANKWAASFHTKGYPYPEHKLIFAQGFDAATVISREERTTDGLTDEYILERACEQHGCTNWAESGTVFCVRHLHGAPDPMPTKVAKRKLELEKE